MYVLYVRARILSMLCVVNVSARMSVSVYVLCNMCVCFLGCVCISCVTMCVFCVMFLYL